MGVPVHDRVGPVAGSALPADRRSVGRGGRSAHGELGLRIGWRWVPEPDETDAPAPTAEDEPRLRAALIRALAWASLRC